MVFAAWSQQRSRKFSSSSSFLRPSQPVSLLTEPPLAQGMLTKRPPMRAIATSRTSFAVSGFSKIVRSSSVSCICWCRRYFIDWSSLRIASLSRRFNNRNLRSSRMLFFAASMTVLPNELRALWNCSLIFAFWALVQSSMFPKRGERSVILGGFTLISGTSKRT